jgi:hypothetical protein
MGELGQRHEARPRMSGSGQGRLCRPRPTTVRFSFHGRHGAALPRTGGLAKKLPSDARSQFMTIDQLLLVGGIRSSQSIQSTAWLSR